MRPDAGVAVVDVVVLQDVVPCIRMHVDAVVVPQPHGIVRHPAVLCVIQVHSIVAPGEVVVDDRMVVDAARIDRPSIAIAEPRVLYPVQERRVGVAALDIDAILGI